MAKYVLDIFLSSTSEDLREYRDTVTEVLGRLGQFTVRMESFGAKPTKPLTTCRDEVVGCDALIVLVGYRYGWIPSTRDGGDGEKSITWWEAQWALDADKPVYAFLIDPKAPWTGPREQDRLVAAGNQNESLAVWRSVRGLQSFRDFLENRTTRALFKNADQLGSLVATSLFPWLLQHAAPMRSSKPSDEVAAPIVPPDTQPEATAGSLKPGQNYWREQIHAVSARELVTAPQPVKVGLVSGHPRVTHPALQGVPITTVSIGGGAGIADDHTTSLGALIAGTGAGGFAGVAPGAELLALSVLNENLGATQASIANAVDRAVVGGARVICLALGTSESSAVVDEAIKEAVEAGVTVVAAAGNEGSETKIFPGATASALAVGAVDALGRPTEWSTYGEWVEIAAPGTDLWLPAGEDGYARSMGTSWSCAIAAGVVALLLQVKPSLTPGEIRKVLTSTAQPLTIDGRKNGNMARLINAFHAVQAV